MRRRIDGFSIGLAALALASVAAVGRTLIDSRPPSGPPETGLAASAAVARMVETPIRAQSNSSPVRYGPTNVDSALIASGDLLDPPRSSAEAAPRPTGPRPILYGLVAGEVAKSRAYIEDPVTGAVRGYQIGETVAGWRLDQIREDRVVLAGAGPGVIEVLLREPTKPRPALFPSTEVMADAQIVKTEAGEAQRIEPRSSPTQQGSAPDGFRGAVPQALGPIPAQLFRPARAQLKTAETVQRGQE